MIELNRLASLLGVLALTCGLTSAADLADARASTFSSASDPFLWLEEIDSSRALEWVGAQNKRSLDLLTKDPRYERYYQTALELAEANDRLPLAQPLSDWAYNFWQDAVHVRGIWRRTSLASYTEGKPRWETILDVDDLARREHRNWVFKGADCLPPHHQRCMIRLSDGGKDAAVSREFDTTARNFVAGGFEAPEAKSSIDWADRDTLLIATNWGPSTLTESGYPYIVKEWRRGQPLEQAREVFRGKPHHVHAFGSTVRGAKSDAVRVFTAAEARFSNELWISRERGELERITLPPNNTLLGLYKNELIFSIAESWQVKDRTWKSGSLLSMAVTDATAHAPSVRLIMEPGPRDAILSASVTATGVLIPVATNVRSRLLRATFSKGEWRTGEVNLPKGGHIVMRGAEPDATTAFVTHEDFLQPTSLYAIGSEATPKKVIQRPAKFDSSTHLVEQLHAVSSDGTNVPYFVVRPRALAPDASMPTLLTAYGGFQASRFPSYSPGIGRLWLEHGGVYVLANIRGGGEFGPAWHQAGLKTKRQIVYDDFIAVAEDLIRRKITSPRHLGIQGGSNGGLLMGVMLTQRPDLFRGVVVQVPLLDMLRYHKLLAGASWIDEYGSPDVPEERAWLTRLSPYHNLTRRNDFPVPLIVTSTKDDRVHPAHARKYAARLESLQMPFFYYENVDGGHSAGANLRDHAKRQALEFTYLAQRLMD